MLTMWCQTDRNDTPLESFDKLYESTVDDEAKHRKIVAMNANRGLITTKLCTSVKIVPQRARTTQINYYPRNEHAGEAVHVALELKDKVHCVPKSGSRHLFLSS